MNLIKENSSQNQEALWALNAQEVVASAGSVQDPTGQHAAGVLTVPGHATVLFPTHVGYYLLQSLTGWVHAGNSNDTALHDVAGMSHMIADACACSDGTIFGCCNLTENWTSFKAKKQYSLTFVKPSVVKMIHELWFVSWSEAESRCSRCERLQIRLIIHFFIFYLLFRYCSSRCGMVFVV